MFPVQDASYAPVIKVTLFFTIMYFGFLMNQTLTKFVLFFDAKKRDPKANLIKIKYHSNEKLALVADRTVGNCMEQAIPFLSSLWLCAIFHSPDYAARMGWFWVISRVYYPFAFAGGLPWLFFSTVPGYIFIGLLWSPLVTKMLSN
jgi:hypothetical protein